jgi:hypothetical protein
MGRFGLHSPLINNLVAFAQALSHRIELTKFWAKVITKTNSRTVARAEIPDDVIERMAEWEYQMLRGLFLDDGRASYIEREQCSTNRRTTVFGPVTPVRGSHRSSGRRWSRGVVAG